MLRVNDRRGVHQIGRAEFDQLNRLESGPKRYPM